MSFSSLILLSTIFLRSTQFVITTFDRMGPRRSPQSKHLTAERKRSTLTPRTRTVSFINVPNDTWKRFPACHLTCQAGRGIDDLECDSCISMSYELVRTKASHARWIHEGTEGFVEGEGLKDCKRDRCKEIGLVVFGFEPLETWIETIRSLFTPQLQNQNLPKLPPIFLLLAFSQLTRSKDLASALFKV